MLTIQQSEKRQRTKANWHGHRHISHWKCLALELSSDTGWYLSMRHVISLRWILLFVLFLAGKLRYSVMIIVFAVLMESSRGLSYIRV